MKYKAGFLSIILISSLAFIFLQTHQAIDCTDEPCNTSYQFKTYDRCEPWRASNLSLCESTNYISAYEVDFISDHSNHISENFTEEQYNVNYYPEFKNKSAWGSKIINGSIFYTQNIDEPTGGEASTRVYKFDINQKDHEKIYDFNRDPIMNDGVLGLEIDPRYPDHKYLYIYYTSEQIEVEDENESVSDQRVSNKVSRFNLKQENLAEDVLIDNIPGNTHHSGGRMVFGPDENLYITTGDAEKPHLAADLSSKAGKILRISPNGSKPESNPFYDKQDTEDSIYSYGHRNSQGLAFSRRGDLYSSEHGGFRKDEINRIESGKNYGWPNYKCQENRKDLDGDNTAPVICYDEYTLAPSGMTIIDDDSHEWHGDMFVAGLRANHVQRIKNVDSSHGDLKNEIFYFPENDLVSNRIRNVEYYNGSLWVFGDERGLAQISPK